MEPFRVEIERRPDRTTLVRPSGHVNAMTAADFEKALKSAGGAGQVVVLDLSGVTYMASPGFGAVLGLLEPQRKSGGDIRFAAMTGSVREAFSLLGLGNVIRSFDTVEAALESAGP